jgi:hypothetical protein
MQQSVPADRLERQREPAGLGLARDVFLEQQRVCSDRAGIPGLDQRRDLVAKAQDAARLQPDDRNAALGEWRERGDAALRLATRLAHQPDRQECASAAQWTLLTLGRHRQMDGVSGSGQHSDCRGQILGLEITAEGVGKQHDLSSSVLSVVMPGLGPGIHVLGRGR